MSAQQTGELEVPESMRRSPDADDRVSETDARQRQGDDVATDDNALAIGAIVLGVLAVFFLPIVLGPIGIVLAVMAKNRGQPLSKVALWVAIGGTVIGLAFAVLAFTMNGAEIGLGAID